MQTELSAKIRKHHSRLPKDEKKRVGALLLLESAEELDKLTEHYKEIILPTMQYGELLEKWATEAKAQLEFYEDDSEIAKSIIESCPLTEKEEES